MITVTKRLEFDAGHRVLGHQGRCRHLHGHRYVAEITVETPVLNGLGMVVDFGVIKTLVGGWLDKHWDHNILLNPDDPLLRAFPATPKGFQSKMYIEVFGGRAPYLFSSDLTMTGNYGRNPTAENMAMELYGVAQTLLKDHSLRVVKVRIWETPSSYAEYAGTETVS